MRFVSMNFFRAMHGRYHHHHFGRHERGDRHASDFVDHLQSRIGRKLDLNTTQQDLLGSLLHQLQDQREGLRSAVPDLKALMAGDSFDRAAATQMFDARLDAMRATGPALIGTVGDFFDSLDGEQKQALRFLMRMRRGRHA